MDSGPAKRCLLCGQTVLPNAVKCSSCGKGRFETEKRHAEPRPTRPSASAAAASPRAAASRAAAPARPEPAAGAPAQPPRGGFLSRLLGRLSGKR